MTDPIIVTYGVKLAESAVILRRDPGDAEHTGGAILG
jgi:hypothetical protein